MNGCCKGCSCVPFSEFRDRILGKPRYLLAEDNERLRAALVELVDLKDGPRDEEYERRKPLAWQTARDLLR